MKWNILRGVSGEYEITRSLGAAGVIAYIVLANSFEGWELFGLHKDFDITAYCLAFPTGLATAIAAVGITAGQKDKATASAQATKSAAETAANGG